GGTIGARIYNSATQALVASANTTASGTNLTVTIPISATLTPGVAYRIAFYNSAGGAADVLDPTPAGAAVTPCNDTTGYPHVSATSSATGDVFPNGLNPSLPYIPVTGSFAGPPTAYYSISAGGAQLVIGDVPRPIQATANTNKATKANFPPLLIAPN